MEHKQRLAAFRKLLKSHAKTLSVRNGTGTAWGWTEIMGSGEYRCFTEQEVAALNALKIPHGANYAVIEYTHLQSWIDRLSNAS